MDSSGLPGWMHCWPSRGRGGCGARLCSSCEWGARAHMCACNCSCCHVSVPFRCAVMQSNLVCICEQTLPMRTRAYGIHCWPWHRLILHDIYFRHECQQTCCFPRAACFVRATHYPQCCKWACTLRQSRKTHAMAPVQKLPAVTCTHKHIHARACAQVHCAPTSAPEACWLVWVGGVGERGLRVQLSWCRAVVAGASLLALLLLPRPLMKLLLGAGDLQRYCPC